MKSDQSLLAALRIVPSTSSPVSFQLLGFLSTVPPQLCELGPTWSVARLEITLGRLFQPVLELIFPVHDRVTFADAKHGAVQASCVLTNAEFTYAPYTLFP